MVLLSYLNTILAFGPERFFDRCRERGVLGVVVPDVPVEEAADLQATARGAGRGRDLPGGSHEHRRAAGPHRRGGLRLHLLRVDHGGHRGAGGADARDLPEFVARLRRHTDLPLAVGFGVTTAEQADEVAATPTA